MVKAAGAVQNEKSRTASQNKQADDRIKLEMLKAALQKETEREQAKQKAEQPKSKPKSKE